MQEKLILNTQCMKVIALTQKDDFGRTDNMNLRTIMTIITITFFATMCFAGSIHAQDMTEMRVVYTIPDMDNVQIQHGIKYRTLDSTDLTMDIYYPPNLRKDARLPVVIFVFGYSDSVAQEKFGLKLKDFGMYISWGELIAASGMIAITYETRQPDSDIDELLKYVRQNATSLKIDENKIGIWSCSGNVPVAQSVLMNERKEYFKCAVLYYGLMLTPDQEHFATIDTLSGTFNFSTAGLENVKYLHEDLPLFIVRAGLDFVPKLNETLDYFITDAVSRNAPIVFINYAQGSHAFDGLDDNEQSRQIIRQTIDFMTFHLLSRE